MAIVAVDDSCLKQADSQPKIRWLGLRVGGRLALSFHQMNRVNSRNDLCYDDSTINIVVVIIIIIIIIKLTGDNDQCTCVQQLFLLPTTPFNLSLPPFFRRALPLLRKKVFALLLQVAVQFALLLLYCSDMFVH